MSYWPDGMKVDPIAQWPGAMTVRRVRSKFDSTLSSTMGKLQTELRALNGKNVRLQIAIPPSAFRLDGYPRSTATPEHPGIILTLESKHGPLSYPCDQYPTWPENLRAIALSLEALRKVDRYGVTKRGEQYKGSLAIEASVAGMIRDSAHARTILYGASGMDISGATLPAIVRRALIETHPDREPIHHRPPGDYALVLAAEKYLKQQGAIS